MSANKPFSKRRNIYIKKGFQTNFSIKFLVLIVIEALMAIALFGYLSRGTVITGYTGSELVIAKTREYFLPTVLLVNLVVIGVTAAAGFVVMLLVSHKIAGPLYRFEKSLDEICRGDLTHRFTLRSKDEMGELADKLNRFNSKMEHDVARIQRGIDELEGLIEELKAADSTGAGRRKDKGALLSEASEKLAKLKEAAGHFRTSETLKHRPHK